MFPAAAIIAMLILPPLFVLAVMGSLRSAAAAKKFSEDYRMRKALPDDEMIAKFFTDADMDSAIPVRVRRIFGRELELDPERILPDDDFIEIDAELDLIELLTEVEEEFGIHISNDVTSKMKGSVRDVSELVQQKLELERPTPELD